MAKQAVLDADTLLRLQAFERVMQERRYSANTIKTYVSMVRQFFAHVAPRPWNRLVQADVIAYNYAEYILKGRSHSTQNQAINAIKLFYLIHGKGGIVPNDIVRPRKERRLPDVLSQFEVQQIILSTGNQKHRTLLIVIYGAGLRIGEALRLQLTDIRRSEGLLYIRRSKGKKDRRVPLSPMMLSSLERYYRAYRPKRYVFEGVKGGMYTASSARKVLKRSVRKAGIRRHVTLHTLRHSYATHLLEKGVGLRYIQDILGHHSPKTTMLYTHVSGKRLSEIRSPLDDLAL